MMGMDRADLLRCLNEEPSRLRPEGFDWPLIDAEVRRGFESRAVFTSWLLRRQGMTLRLPPGQPRCKDGTELKVEQHRHPHHTGDGPTFQVTRLSLPFTHVDFAVPDGLRVQEYANTSGLQIGDAVEKTVVGAILDAKGAGKLKRRPFATSLAGDVSDMMSLAHESHHWGSFAVLCPLGWGRTVEGAKAIVACDDIEGILTVHPLACLDGSFGEHVTVPSGAGKVVLVQVTPDVLRLVVGMDPMVVRWEDGFKALCLIVPQVHAGFEGETGVVTAG